jgi:radical SAM superfamily enzyme YgiQ (UPF0313 family)
MKLALITPRGVFFSNDTEMVSFFRTIVKVAKDNFLIPQRGYWSGGSLGLLIVAALTPPDFKIDFIDENYEEINFEEKYDLVGVTAMTQQATRAYEIADEFRKRGVKVVIGGIHATVMAEEAKEHADVVVVGEAENVWQTFIDDFRKGEMKPYYKSTIPADLTRSPLPRYDLLKKYDYKMIWVQTTRGCPHDCDFCSASNVYGRVIRHKSIGQVLGEINYIRGLWDEPVLNFADDNMFADKKYSYELVKRLGQTELRWGAQSDVSVARDDVFLELLRRSNCMQLFIGFETLSKKNKVDKHGWKQAKIDDYPKAIKKIQATGIGILGSFILGLDGDDVSVFDDLSNFIVDNFLYAAQVMVLTPLPGTRLRERLSKENRLLSSDWKRYTFFDVNFIPRRMTPEELQNGVLEIYKRIYSRDVKMTVVRHFKEIYANLHRREARFSGLEP